MSDLRAEFQRIYEEHSQLTPQLVVDEWRPPSHPQHERLEWNNKIAGEAYRRIQAHELIRSVKLVYAEADETAPEKSIRQWHAVRSESPGNGGYIYEPADRVATNPLLRAIVLRDMERDWNSLKARYSAFEEFVELVSKDMQKAS